MSKPFPGNYFIVNAYNQGLAVTYRNDKLGAPLTVNPFLRSPDQMWTISNYSDRETQTISPAGRPYLQVAPGPRVYDFVMILPSAGYVWTIKGNGTYIIKGDDPAFYWTLYGPNPGQPVSKGFAPDDNSVNLTQRWFLLPAY